MMHFGNGDKPNSLRINSSELQDYHRVARDTAPVKR